ncbi:MAG TPA: universal stress protein [Xanthobacteraceae bacterium]|nr:universal stress protein [Xanthobacteraceae bacterium]
MIKDLVVNLSGGESDVAAAYAISIAKAFNAHLTGIAFVYEPVIPATIMGGIPTEIIESQRTDSLNWAENAVAAFNRQVASAGITAVTRTVDASLAGAAESFGQIARRFDLSVVAQAEQKSSSPADLIIEGAMFQSGRPVIIVPVIQTEGIKLDRVAIGWDGSRTAARAVADAMPLLKRAGQVEIVVVFGEHDKTYQTQGAIMTEHLLRHGVNAEIKRIPAPKVDVQSTLLNYVADSGTNLLVMGAYGHSRLREFILGGVTRSMLSSMTIPVLMSH